MTKQEFQYYALNDRWTQENWAKDHEVTRFLREFRKKLDTNPTKITTLWKKAYDYAVGKENILLYAGLRALNQEYVTSRRNYVTSRRNYVRRSPLHYGY